MELALEKVARKEVEIRPEVVTPWLTMDGGGLVEHRSLWPQIRLNPALTVILLSWVLIWEEEEKEAL